MLDLSSVTLVMVETICHDLAKIAVEDCLKKASFGEVLVFSDKHLGIPGADQIKVENWPTKLGWSEWLWYGVPKYVKTPQALLLQWDAGISRPECWRDEFLSYDYIGAPWGWHPDDMNVGNSGFSLRSKRLQDFLAANRETYPVSDPEDAACSRIHRKALEAQGFKWADPATALDFAFENQRRPAGDHFGYHGIWNWAYVLEPDDLARRIKLAERIPYIVSTGMLDRLDQYLHAAKCGALSKIVMSINSMKVPLPAKIYWPLEEWNQAVEELEALPLTKARGLLKADIDEPNVLICGIPVIPCATPSCVLA